ncbi:hypothetical protein QQ045_011964 [Rhodiola kirilowii]
MSWMLLANYTVYSMGNSAALATVAPISYLSTTTEFVSIIDTENTQGLKFDSSVLKSFSVSSSNGKTASIDGNSASKTESNPAEETSVALSKEELRLWSVEFNRGRGFKDARGVQRCGT